MVFLPNSEINSEILNLHELHANNPDKRILDSAAGLLRSGGVIITPTDTLYGFACLLSNREGIDRICRLVLKKPEKANLSMLCADLKHISDFTMQFGKSTYKLLNRNLPGPFTFILRANNRVPKLFLNKRKTIGIRVPDSRIVRELIELCGEPLVSTSVHLPEEMEETVQDSHQLEKLFGNRVDMILFTGPDAGAGSAVIDCTGSDPVVIREGPKEIL